MSVSPVTTAPERQSPADFRDFHVEEPVPTFTGAEAEIPRTETADDPVPGIGALPLVLIAGGIGIYFIAIAAFTSFAGVAVGVTVIVLGGIIYTCRGLTGRSVPSGADLNISPDAHGGAPMLPYETDDPEGGTFVFPEIQNDHEAKTEGVHAAV